MFRQLDEKPDILNYKPDQNTKDDLLVAGIAHDLNNILATISGYAEMLNEDLPKDSALTEKTVKIISAVSKAKALTGQLLDSERHSGHDKKAVNINGILNDTLELFRSSLPPGIKINTDLSEENIMLFADPAQLFRVFFNLVSNAVRSMEEKGGIISVSTYLVKGSRINPPISDDFSDADYVLVTIRDNGSGMHPSLIQRIFEPYYTTRAEGKGTGLGLYVVRGIINDLGGKINVSSKENEGSVFDVYLPIIN
jgi:signal transduction histidine kinase